MIKLTTSCLLCAMSLSLWTATSASAETSPQIRPTNPAGEPIVFEYKPTNKAGEPIVFEYKPANNAGDVIVYEYQPANKASEPIVFEYNPANKAGEPIVFEYKPANKAGEPIVFEYKPANNAGEPIVFEYKPANKAGEPIVFEYKPTNTSEGQLRQIPLNPGQGNIAQIERSGFGKGPSVSTINFNAVGAVGITTPKFSGVPNQISAMTNVPSLTTRALTAMPFQTGASLTTSRPTIPVIPTGTIALPNSVSGISGLATSGRSAIPPISLGTISRTSVQGISGGTTQFSTTSGRAAVPGFNSFSGASTMQFGSGFSK